MKEGAILGRTLRPILSAAQAHGLSAAQVRSVGLEPERLAGLDTMVTSSRTYRLLEAIVPCVDIERFAIEVASATMASDMGPLGLALRAAPTGRHAVELLIRYQRVVNALAGFHLLESDAEITLVEDRVGPEGLGRWIAAEITAMTHVHFGRMLFGSEFVASRIELPRTAQFARYAAWAGCAVSGGARRASITFAARFLDLSLPTADEELWCFLRDVLEDRAEPQGLSPIVHQLRRELASVLPEGEPSLADLAGRLGHTPRTLQRRLTDEGQSYSNVLDGLRHELAVTHLRQQKLAIAEIAFSLGFDEVASFHRAFRRWENTTPAAFRRRGAARVK